MKKVFIINQYALNKGDRAVLTALLTNLRQYDFEITVSTSHPEAWKDAFCGVKFVPWGYNISDNYPRAVRNIVQKLSRYLYTIHREMFLKGIKGFHYLRHLCVNSEFYKALIKADIVVSTGGHHITTLLSRDVRGALMYDLSLAVFCNKKVILWSQSIGPLEFYNKRNELFVYKVMSKIDKICVRDSQSFEFLQSFNKDKIYQTYETVFLLNQLFDRRIKSAEKKNIVGIAIYSTKNRSEQEEEHYILTLAKFLSFLIEKEDVQVKFFPMEIKGSAPDDRRMIHKIISCISNPLKCVVEDKDLKTEDHIQKVAKCRYFIGHKTHSVIFALAAGVPLLALAYHPKTIDFMKQFSLEEYAIDDSNLEYAELVSRFNKLRLHVDEIGENSFNRSRYFSEVISSDLKTVLNA
jgi:colanic acid/amylovoran biosynthesis protein